MYVREKNEGGQEDGKRRERRNGRDCGRRESPSISPERASAETEKKRGWEGEEKKKEE